MGRRPVCPFVPADVYAGNGTEYADDAAADNVIRRRQRCLLAISCSFQQRRRASWPMIYAVFRSRSSPHKKGCCSVDAGDAHFADRLDLPFTPSTSRAISRASWTTSSKNTRKAAPRTRASCATPGSNSASSGLTANSSTPTSSRYVQMKDGASIVAIGTRINRTSSSGCARTCCRTLVPDRRPQERRGACDLARGRPQRCRQARQRRNLLCAEQRSRRLHQESPSRAGNRGLHRRSRRQRVGEPQRHRSSPSASRASASAPRRVMCWRSSRRRATWWSATALELLAQLRATRQLADRCARRNR